MVANPYGDHQRNDLDVDFQRPRPSPYEVPHLTLPGGGGPPGPRSLCENTQVTIWTRPPELEDSLPLAHMVDQAWRTTYQSMLPEQFWDSYPTAQRVSDLRESITDPVQRGLVAEADGALVGWAERGPSRASTVGIEPARPTEMYSLYVHAPGGGLGQRLLDELLGDEPAELWIFEENVRAQRFYERNGFRPEGARHIYRPDTAGVLEVRFVR